MLKSPVFSFFMLTFALSWLLWSPLYFLAEASVLWALPGAWGPTLAALILTWRSSGKAGVRTLLRKVLKGRVSIAYYVFAIVGMVALLFLSVGIHKLLGGASPDWGTVLEGMGLAPGKELVAVVLYPVFFFVNTLVGGPIAEELGWRGFAQERLQQQMPPWVAGLIIGFFWAVWHLPLLLSLPQATGHMPFVAYLPVMMAMSVVFAWLYVRTGGSVLLAILLHGGLNTANGFIGTSLFADPQLLWIHVGVILALAYLLGCDTKLRSRNSGDSEG